MDSTSTYKLLMERISQPQFKHHHNNYTDSIQQPAQLLTPIYLTPQALYQALSSFHQGHSPSIPQEWLKDLDRVSHQTIQVVEMRKEMEKVLEIQQLQLTHFNIFSQLIDKNLCLQTQNDQIATQLKQLQSQHVATTLQHITKQSQSKQDVSTLGLTQIRLMIKELNLNLHNTLNESTDQQRTDSSLTEGKEEGVIFVKESNAHQILLSKQMLRGMLEQVTLRQELLSERENIWLDYQTSNHELVQALLSSKERDKNIQRVHREKYEQLSRGRHDADVELQQLNHTQSNLVALYEAELLTLKRTLQDQQKHKQQIINIHNQSTTKFMQQLKQVEHDRQIQVAEMDRKIGVLKSENEKLESQCLRLGSSLKNMQQLAEKSDQKNQSLQSQLNEHILRSSQTTKVKQQLASKLEKVNEREVELVGSNKELKAKLQEAIQSSMLLKELQTDLENKLSKSLEALQKGRAEIKSLEDRIGSLQDELTNVFILHNQQTQGLSEIIQNKDQQLSQSFQERRSLQQQFEQQKSLQDRVERQSLQNVQGYGVLKEQVLKELSVQFGNNREIIDNAVSKLSIIFLQ